MSDYQKARQALGARLRELRADACLSGRDLADCLGWPASKVSKIELGRQTPSRDDLTAWACAVGQAALNDELINRLRTLESHYATWRRQVAAGNRARQDAYGLDERNSSEYRNLETICVPGLLQTADYARHILAGVSALHGASDDVEAGVESRIRRQQILYEPGHRLHFVIWEAALHVRVGPPGVLAGQLDRLAGAVGLSNFTVGVLPLDLDAPVTPHHGFVIYDRRLVRIETPSAEISVTDATEIEAYLAVWDRMADLSVGGAKAHRLIARARSALPDT